MLQSLAAARSASVVKAREDLEAINVLPGCFALPIAAIAIINTRRVKLSRVRHDDHRAPDPLRLDPCRFFEQSQRGRFCPNTPPPARGVAEFSTAARRRDSDVFRRAVRSLWGCRRSISCVRQEMIPLLLGRVPFVVAALAAIVASLIAATLMHRFVEAPAIKLGQRLARTARPTTADVADFPVAAD